MSRLWMRAIGAGALLAVGAAGACGGTVTRGGSETNWFVTCTEDSQCVSGVCACGLCTDVCDSQTKCPAAERCVEQGSPVHDRLCGGAQNAPTGLCLAACVGEGDCDGNETCEEGACAPRASWKSEHLRAAKTGDPCLPADLQKPDFGAFSLTEVATETGAASCESALCLVNHFQGRAGCPYGAPCETTGEAPVPVTATVTPQLVSRAPDDVMTCTCRCDGPPGEGPFCACPDDLECRPLIGTFGRGGNAFTGSYCVKRGTYLPDPSALNGAPTCNRTLANCEGR